MEVSVIVPVYEGEKTLEKLFEGIQANLKSFGSFEVLFVFDCGSDKSWEILKELKSKYPREIRIFQLKKNYGQHNATLLGISKSAGKIIVTMDEDLQHDPKYLGSLISEQKEGNFDVVYARFSNPKHSLLRKVASKILQKSLKVLIPGLGYYSSFRVIKKETAQKLQYLRNSYTFIDASLMSVNPSIGFLDIDHRENKTRGSTYNILKLTSHAVRLVLAYSAITRWLLTISFAGILLSVVWILSDLAGKEIRIWIIATGIILFLTGMCGVLIHRREVRNNSLPLIAIEND